MQCTWHHVCAGPSRPGHYTRGGPSAGATHDTFLHAPVIAPIAELIMPAGENYLPHINNATHKTEQRSRALLLNLAEFGETELLASALLCSALSLSLFLYSLLLEDGDGLGSLTEYCGIPLKETFLNGAWHKEDEDTGVKRWVFHSKPGPKHGASKRTNNKGQRGTYLKLRLPKVARLAVVKEQLSALAARCYECQGFGMKGCPRCGSGGLTPEQRGER
ncbi:hypothetical protein AXF42_Ash014641 [Apostasia shenzhenica]|uniref:Uncharacterized protein n=1 Tax=Apostasia shenzhenica TaxID=1088818 RepID=A0A2I0AK82_9ASPA|nr:hypothetical protein AXF42_Ash014641 [Apostasia shenzhenica]